MRFSDIMLGALALAFGAVLAGFATTFPAIPGQRYGAGAFPMLIAGGFAGCGIALIVRGYRQRPRVHLITLSDWTRRPGAVAAILVTISLAVSYILFSEQIGFIPTMAVLLLVLFRLLRVPWARTTGFALVGTLFLDLIFRSVLLVPLPLGIIPPLPW